MLAARLRRNAQEAFGALAVKTQDESATFGQLLELSEEYTGRWADLRGQRVGLCITASAKVIAALAALDELGCHAFLLAASNGPDWAATAKQLGLSAVLAGGDLSIAARWPEAPQAEGSAVTILTSGTSGKPKVVNHRWESLARPVRQSPEFAGTRWLLVYPLNLYAGLQVFLQAFWNRAVLVMPPVNTPRELAKLMKTEQIEFVSGTPTFWRQLALFASPEDLAGCRLKQITMGGEAAPQDLLDRLAELFPGVRLVHIYATTELGRCFSVTDGKAGFPARFLDRVSDDGVEMRIRDGILEVRSANAMSRYDAASVVQGTAEDWFSTGDLVELCGDRVTFLGRTTDIINVGGHKVHPAKVEAVLRKVPGIASVRVYGKRSPITSEIVAADLALIPGSDSSLVKRAVEQLCAQELAPFEKPRLIQFVPEIMTSAAGKTIRR